MSPSTTRSTSRPSRPRPSTAYGVHRSRFLDTIDDDAVDALLSAMAEPSSPLAMVQIRILGGAMARVPEGEGDARVRAAYPGGTYERLAGIKRRYDPANLFRLNQNIRPSVAIR